MVIMLVIGLVSGCSNDSSVEPGTEKTHVEIYTLSAGTSTYAQGVVIADLITRESDFLRATAIESPSPVRNIMILLEEEGKRKNTFIFSPSCYNLGSLEWN
jgi:TRAP-type uncharacterized transport system substrate-binding protein